MEKFPRNKIWDYFVEAMKYSDAWYDVLDSFEEGKILDYMYDIMNWAKKNGVWGDDNLEVIKEAKEDYTDE